MNLAHGDGSATGLGTGSAGGLSAGRDGVHGEELVAILLTQRLMRGPDDSAPARKLFTLAYAAIDD